MLGEFHDILLQVIDFSRLIPIFAAQNLNI